ncbi:thioredoxin-like protein [Pelagophyceae sp. CCMP2097]|nr:thioredoxin-like protein [Pelagophyceae sp. CCMP2097]|mmetsp:Transcript_17172/g.58783  ORF Transcript_17172/g.58783 Transcript_17172/m.58783 type:complete len:153 (+) Transcript_17172:96-554(+)
MLFLFLAALWSAAEGRVQPRAAVSAWRRVQRGGAHVLHAENLGQFEMMTEFDVGPETVVIIDFGAGWCGPCRSIAPQFEALAAEYAPIMACSAADRASVFVKVDVDENREASARFNVASLPTFVVLVGGVEVARVVGADMNKLKKVVSGLVK